MRSDSYEVRGSSLSAAQAGSEARAIFLLKTYTHLFGALSAFALLEVALFKTGLADSIMGMLAGASWLLVLGGFMVVAWLASATAHRVQSLPLQYAALAAYVVAEALIFVPLLWIANARAPGTIASAAYISFAGFAGLTFVAFLTRIDFSFLRAMLLWAGICALIAIVAAVLLGAQLGTWFSVGMIAFAGAGVLFKTSRVMQHYPTDRYVAASLELFASIALMFWYVLRLLNSRR
jgi:uncharacterized protein